MLNTLMDNSQRQHYQEYLSKEFISDENNPYKEVPSANRFLNKTSKQIEKSIWRNPDNF